MIEIDEFYRKHRVDCSDRPLDELCILCPKCATFYSRDNAPETALVLRKDTDFITEEYHCNCHGRRTKMDDCHEIGVNSPAMEWDANQMKRILYNLEGEVREIEKTLLNYE